jgi:hypothetical protein
MHLRSGRNLALPIDVKDSSPPKAVDVPKSSSSINTRDAFAAKFKSYAKEHELPENQNFIGSITYFGSIFGLIHDNFSLVVSPGFDVSGRFKTSIIDRIQYWRKEISISTLKHLLEDEVFDVENIRAAVAKTNAVVEAVAKQFEDFNKA